MTIALEEGVQCAAQFLGEILVTNRAKKRERRFVGLELTDAAGALGEMTFEFGVDVGRELMLDEIGEKSDELGARAFGFSHETPDGQRNAD